MTRSCITYAGASLGYPCESRDGRGRAKHDLAISKYVAGRAKDLEFTSVVARAEMTDYEKLGQRLAKTELAHAVRSTIKVRIDADFRNRE
jgi:hypothetical protein